MSNTIHSVPGAGIQADGPQGMVKSDPIWCPKLGKIALGRWLVAPIYHHLPVVINRGLCKKALFFHQPMGIWDVKSSIFHGIVPNKNHPILGNYHHFNQWEFLGHQIIITSPGPEGLLLDSLKGIGTFFGVATLTLTALLARINGESRNAGNTWVPKLGLPQ